MLVALAAVALIAIAVIGVLTYLLVREGNRFDVAAKEWALERGALLQRIQAPKAAVAAHGFEKAPLIQPAPMGSDEEPEESQVG